MTTNKNTTAKTSYRITNWKDYNKALATRGSLTIWVSQEALASWKSQKTPGKSGHPFEYSNDCIRLLGILREVYRLPLRQTIGFTASIFQLMGVTLPLPDYSTLSRRMCTVAVPLGARVWRSPLVLVVDSTGLKVCGEGEWKVRLHGKTKTRVWRKLHLAQDYASWQVVALTMTDAPATDHQQIPPLLDQVASPIAEVIGDMAYDKRSVRYYQAERKATPIIPPRRIAQYWSEDTEAAKARNEAIAAIHANGRSRWKRQVGYHGRSRVETTMWRYKTTFGDKLVTKTDQAQLAQLRLCTYILNTFTRLGMPRKALPIPA
jgi:hypothetical protein